MLPAVAARAHMLESAAPLSFDDYLAPPSFDPLSVSSNNHGTPILLPTVVLCATQCVRAYALAFYGFY